MPLNSFAQTLTVAGIVVSVDPGGPSFSVKERSGDTFEAIVGPATNYRTLSNLDGVARDNDNVGFNLKKYAVPGRRVFVRGVYQENGGGQRFEARDVFFLHSEPQRYL